ncbi:MAG: flagellar basal body P-ring formation chaperone FlgA [bacterium]
MTKIATIIIFVLICLTPVVAIENPEAAVTKVIENYIITQKPELTGLDIQITYKFADKTFAQLKNVPDTAILKVMARESDFNPLGNVIFPLIVTLGEEEQKIFIRAEVKVLKKIVVAGKLIKRGQLITEELLTTAEKDIAMIPQKYFTGLEQLKESEAKTNIPKNSVLYEWMIKTVPQIRRGDSVTINVMANNLLVKSAGVALEDGYIGKMIRVRRTGSDKIVDGKLVTPNEVKVVL